MRRLVNYIAGIALGVGAAIFFTSKSGKGMCKRLLGAASGRLLTAAPDQFPTPEENSAWPGPEGGSPWQGPASIDEPAAADESVIVVEASPAEPTVVSEGAPEAPDFAETFAPTVSPDSSEGSPEEDGVVDQQMKMRRRIEETRERLKAKAFDAMTSGESALLPYAADEPTEEAL